MIIPSFKTLIRDGIMVIRSKMAEKSTDVVCVVDSSRRGSLPIKSNNNLYILQSLCSQDYFSFSNSTV